MKRVLESFFVAILTVVTVAFAGVALWLFPSPLGPIMALGVVIAGIMKYLRR